MINSRQYLCNKILPKKVGFTLVESLLVISLLSVIAVAVYQSLVAGLKIQERYRFFKEGEILLLFEKVDQELGSAMPYSKIPFEGALTRVSFPVVAKVPVDKAKKRPAGSWEEQIGRVEYFFDREKHGLYRRQANYSQALQNSYGQAQLLAGNLKSVEFHYYICSLINYHSSSHTSACCLVI